MPKKSRRVAARQAQLSGRAKRERPHGPAGIPAARPSVQAEGAGSTGGDSAERQPSSRRRAQQTPVMEPTNSPMAAAARPRGRAPQLPPIETYFVPELRRIGLASAVIFIILLVLMFVLR